MADRIFPNTYQEEPLDSDLVFKGIDWDNFNKKLAEVKNAPAAELPEEFREVLAGKSEKMPEDVLNMFKEKAKKERDDEDAEDLSDVPEQLREHVKEKQDSKKDDDKESMKHHKGEMKKKASPIVFNHPSQLSAEAIEAAIAAGDDNLKNAILAARQERRVRLASKIEAQVEAENDLNTKLAQRRAYRENIVKGFEKKAKNNEDLNRVASVNHDNSSEDSDSTDFVKVSEATNKARTAFAQKALAQGFPQEYVDAILGNTEEIDNTVEIRNVMSSELSMNVKKSAVESMVKVATLTDADYSRLIRYWKEELGYGDQDWIDALFTKKYD
jgi:hypothetical protein